jgi:hypothetical protein
VLEQFVIESLAAYRDGCQAFASIRVGRQADAPAQRHCREAFPASVESR